MLDLLIQIVTLSTNIILVSFVAYYIMSLHHKEKKLDNSKEQTDAKYHHIVDEALAKERKIIDDATHEADQIITGANYVRQGSQATVDHAIQQIVTEIQKDSLTTAQAFMQSYSSSLTQLSQQSVNDFQHIVKGLEADLQLQVKQFHEALLPQLEKELEVYKETRMKQTDQMVSRVVQKASQEVFNKSLPLEDHHTIIIEALEKAKKEGMFN